MKLYRSRHSWVHAFTAFRLPSPLSASDDIGRAASTEVLASLKRICREAQLPDEKACGEWLKLLPRAEKHLQSCCNTRAAWGRASAEWPEFQSGRRLVELFLVWKTASGNLERRFRRFREVRCEERAKMLDASVENCMLVEQAPPSKMLRGMMTSSASDSTASLHQAVEKPQTVYLQQILKLHEQLHGTGKTRVRRSERRDCGVPRQNTQASAGLATTESAFGRKREAAIASVVTASSSKRQRVIRDAPLGLAQIAQEAGDESAQKNLPTASAAVVMQVAKRDGAAKEKNLRGAVAAEKARDKREQKVIQSSTQPPKARDEDLLPTLKAGVMLARLEDVEARRKAQRLGFSLTTDPLDFVARVIKVPASARKGHVVLAPVADTDYALSSTIAAALLGCFYATSQDFLKNDDGSPSGIAYKGNFKNPKHSFHVAASAALAGELPTLPQVLRSIAQAPGSCFKFYLSERKLCKFFKKTAKTTPQIGQRIFIICKPGDSDSAELQYRTLYISPRSFLLKFAASERALCPGYQPA